MSEPEFNIDDAAAQFDKGKPIDGAPPADPPAAAPAGDEADAGTDNPPGFKSYEEYVADGGDPDMYRGKKAYVAEHERINENKALKRDVKSLNQTVKQTAAAVDSLVDQARQQTRAEVEAELAEAIENEDPKAAVAAQKKLDGIDDTPATQTQHVEPGPIADFRDANPIIDRDHDDFDPEFNQDLTAIYNDLAWKHSNGDKVQLSERQVNRLLKKAMKETMELHEMEPTPARAAPADDGEPDESARNTRTQGTRRARTASKREPEQRAEDFKIDNPRNGRDHDASGVRDMIHKTAYDSALKAGKSADDATKEADQAAKDFERSLTQ